MRIEIIGRKVNIKEGFRQRCDKKLKRFDKLFGDEAAAKVTVTVERDRHTVEITVRENGMIFRAERTAKQMEQALDMVCDVLWTQIGRNKQRLQEKIRFEAPVLEDEEYVQEEFELIKTKRFALNPMTVSEAILQMNLLGHQFFLFDNVYDGKISVVYSRKDGGYGLIIPD